MPVPKLPVADFFVLQRKYVMRLSICQLLHRCERGTYGTIRLRCISLLPVVTVSVAIATGDLGESRAAVTAFHVVRRVSGLW